MASSSSAHEYDIMISYCHRNKELVHRVWKRLLKLRFKIWIDKEEMHDNIYTKMYEAITRSRVVIGCVSKAYEVSDACKLEYEYVHQIKKKFIPVIVEKGYKMQNVLELLHGREFYVDFEGGSRFEDAMTELVRILDKQSVAPSGNTINQTNPSSGLRNQESGAVVAQPTSDVEKARDKVPMTPTFTSAREVARVEGVKCTSIACVDDVIFVCTGCYELIKYRWSKRKGWFDWRGARIAITEIKRITIDGVYPEVAAANASDGMIRLYLCTWSKGNRVHRHYVETLKQRRPIDTSGLTSLTGRGGWRMAAWSNYMAISDWTAIVLYKDDLLVRTFKCEHCVFELRISSEYISTRTDPGSHIQVHRWSERESALTLVHAIERNCMGIALSQTHMVTLDWYKNKLVMLDSSTGEERELEVDFAEQFLPRAFARDDLVVGELNNDLVIMKLY